MAQEPTATNQIFGQYNVVKMLKLAAENDMPALIVGDTGTGKTTVVKHLAEKAKAEYIRFNLTGETTVDDFVGKWTLQDGQTVWNDGILLQAMKQGKWLIVDEINVALPEILFVLHSLLDDDKFIIVPNNNGEMVRPAEGFRFFATMNPVDEYAGTKDLNKAFKSRFAIIAYMDFPPASIETKVLVKKTGVAEGIAKKMVLTANEIRKAKKADEVFYTCSTRDLMQWAAVYIKLNDLGESFVYTVKNKANGDGDKIKQIFERMNERLVSIEQHSPDLDLEQLDAKVREIVDAQNNLEYHRDRMTKEVTDQVLSDLRVKLGALTDVVSRDEVKSATEKVAEKQELEQPALEV